MTTDYKSLKLQISQSIAEALKTLASEGLPTAEELAAMLEYPPDANMGDLALPCFKLAKTLRKGPPMIANAIRENLNCEYINKVETAGGYLNMFIDPSYFSKTLLDGILEAKNTYGSTNEGEGKTIVLDYSSPNVAKPFHIGHLGTTVIGHSIRLMYEFNGYKTVSVNHLGDYGTQFGKLIVAYRRWGNKEAVEERQIDELVDLYVRFHKEAEADPSLEDLARAEFTKLEQGDEDNIALWKWFIDISIKEYKKTYAQLGIEFDYYMGESFYTDKMQAQIDYLGEKGLLKVDNGATIVDLEKYNMPPCIILKSDGSTIYHTRDIAAAVYRKNTFNFDKCVYVTSAGQCLHFAQLFKVIELMGHEWYKDMVHVPYGTVSINGAKLATRTGNVVLLKDLFKMAEEKV
nr:arginine--tRNA ligase [Clostridia bacterium]